MRALLVSLLVAGAITQGALAADPPEVIEGAALPLDGDTMIIGVANRFGVGVERAQASPASRSISSRVTPESFGLIRTHEICELLIQGSYVC